MRRRRRLPPRVDQFRDRHGHLRTYYRPGKGPRIPLPNDPTSEEFRLAYAAAYAGAAQPAKSADRSVAEAGTIGALVVSYLRSPEFVELRDTTKRGYISRIETIRTKHGHRSVSGLTASELGRPSSIPMSVSPGPASPS
jgi:hypothetical protein